jgi:hypothetical protein
LREARRASTDPVDRQKDCAIRQPPVIHRVVEVDENDTAGSDRSYKTSECRFRFYDVVQHAERIHKVGGVRPHRERHNVGLHAEDASGRASIPLSLLY